MEAIDRTQIVLRDLQAGDLAPLAELLGSIAEFDADDRSIALELLTIIIEQPAQPDYRAIVAVDQRALLLGYACFGPTPLTEGTFDLYWIAVNPSCSGQGIGGRLLQAAEEKIRQAHGRMLLVETSSQPAYARTRQFYVKNGYLLAETIRDFYREGEDRVTYLKRVG